VDEETIGARLRTLRRWRGMTLTELAGLAGVSPAYLSMVERGFRMLDRRSYIAVIAGALRVSETDLVGGPHLTADPVQSGPHMAIPALRVALETNSLTNPIVDHARSLATVVEAVMGDIEPMRIRCDYIGVGDLLPDALDELHWHAAQPADEAAHRLALETLVQACVAAQETASVLGYFDLAHVAALRAQEAADVLGDPIQVGKADCLRIWTFPRERSWDRRLVVAERAADALEPHARHGGDLQVLGMLTLHAALAAAVVQRPHVVSHWLDQAGRLAQRVPDDMEHNWQSFCGTNVGVWRLAIGVERGESGGTILNLAQAVDEHKLLSRSRRASFLADVGRGLAREPKMQAEAVGWLRRAETTGPQLVRNSVSVRETVAYLLNRATASAGGRELRGMAARMGVPH
jgi:Helix-turn-helix domain